MTLEQKSLTVCAFLTSFVLSMLTTKMKICYARMVKKSKQLRNTILSKGKILGGSIPAEKQGL